jgi:HicB family
MVDEVVAEYSGNLRVRTSPALHSRVAVEAVEQGVSLNQWVVQKLADRKTIRPSTTCSRRKISGLRTVGSATI